MAYNKKHKRRVAHRQNRLWSETQNTWAVPTKVAGAVVFLAVLGVAFVALRHSRDALWDEIAKAEQRQEVLRQDLERESLAWTRMKTQRNLVATLRNNGIAMAPTPQSRRIAMGGYVSPSGRGTGGHRGPVSVAANL